MSRNNIKLVVFYLFYIVYFYFLVSTFREVENWWLVAISIPVAFYFADFFGGMVHFISDYYPCRANVGLKDLFFYEGDRSSKEYALLKKQTMKKVSAVEEVMYDFKNHHPRPNSLARRSAVTLLLSGVVFIGSPFIVLIIALKLWGVSPELQCFVLITMFAMTFTQFAHACAHEHSDHAFIKLLQRTGLFISPEVHDYHHVVLVKDFAVLNGWSNPLINVIAKYSFKRGWFDDEGLIPK